MQRQYGWPQQMIQEDTSVVDPSGFPMGPALWGEMWGHPQERRLKTAARTSHRKETESSSRTKILEQYNEHNSRAIPSHTHFC